MTSDRTIKIAHMLVRGLALANIAAGLGFIAALAFSVIGHAQLSAHLVGKYGAGFDAAAAITVLQSTLLLGVAVVVPTHIVFTNLLRMLDSVEAGDPFVIENARRLQTIAWALLAIQLADICLGLLSGWATRVGLDRLMWSPSVSGWICVLMVFVLARVFARGAAMRDDLSMTI